MLTECIASVLYRHTGVITRRVKKKCCIALKINSKFYQHLTLHAIIIKPRMAGENRCNISSKHCFRSLCISNLYFNLKDQFLFAQNIEQCGKYAKTHVKMLKTDFFADHTRPITLTLFTPEYIQNIVHVSGF